MNTRLLWFAVGTSAGVYATVRARRLAYRFTPEGVADQLAAARAGLRAFGDEVRVGMAEREVELTHTLGLDEHIGVEAARAPEPVLTRATRPRALAASAAAHPR